MSMVVHKTIKVLFHARGRVHIVYYVHSYESKTPSPIVPIAQFYKSMLEALACPIEWLLK